MYHTYKYHITVVIIGVVPIQSEGHVPPQSQVGFKSSFQKTKIAD